MKHRVLCLALVVAFASATCVMPASAAPLADRGAAPLSLARPSIAGECSDTPTRDVPLELPAEFKISVEGDDDFPGVPRDWGQQPFSDTLNFWSDEVDVYPVFLEAGEEWSFNLTATGVDFDLALYDPTGEIAAVSDREGTAEVVWGRSEMEGYWYVAAWTLVGDSGSYNLGGMFESMDDNIAFPVYPSWAPPALPAANGEWIWLDSFSEWDDVRSVRLYPGDELVVSLSPDWANSSTYFMPNLAIYGPSATDVWVDDPLVERSGAPYPQTMTYTATTPGTYYIDVWQVAANHEYGWAALTWAGNLNRVYRFYNARLGTHFYTATEAEKLHVMANLSGTYQYEGAAYRVDPAMNHDTIWRFYKPATGTHFYTADPTERDRVASTMGHIYQYEGPAYNVSRSAGPGYSPVWRFFRPSTGTHLYTSDAAEANNIATHLSHIYNLDGIAFYIGQGM